MVILGPSGSGKSTLLRTINHLEKIDSGHITIDGEYVGYRRKGDLLYELKEREILKRRIDLMLALPMASLDRLAIQREIKDIGTR